MGRKIVENAEELLDAEYSVLDKGFIRLVDYFGDDSRIVEAARVSYGKGTKTEREDADLIDYLLRNSHTSPFEMVEVLFHIKAPLVVSRQIVRHRTASLNEISGRYSVMKDEAYVPSRDRICKQSTNNKQGSGESFDDITAALAVKDFQEESEAAFCSYQEYINSGMARELARINLPLSTYTEWYWKIDLNNLMKFLSLRLDAHAQWETRQYAEKMYDIVKVICPLTMKSFKNHILDGVKLSGKEKDAIFEALSDRQGWSSEALNLSDKESTNLLDKFNKVV